MTNTLQPSHELTALDLLQVRLEDLPLDDLQDQAKRIADTILGLVGLLVNAMHLSPAAMANIRRLEKRLRERLQEVRELIELRQLEAMAAEIERQEREQEAQRPAGAGRRMRI
jgi:hypothetical protein